MHIVGAVACFNENAHIFCASNSGRYTYTCNNLLT